ncbi:MAG: hypothetical protein GY950_36335, partial [bacterium]|nr:hypothetical protein [bacterium]
MIVKVLCHFPAGELMFASENIPTENSVYPQENVPGPGGDGSGQIVVTSPGLYRAYCKGDTITIACQTSFTEEIKIRAKKSDLSDSYVIIDEPPSDGSPYTYTFPESLPSGEYFIRVRYPGGIYGDSYNFRVLPAGNWQNRIITISSLSRNIGEDKSYEISGISIEFNDTDRFFRNMMSASDRYIAGNKVELFTEDGQLIYTGTVEKWQFTEDAFVLHINDKLSGLDVMINDLISAEAFPDIAEEADGKSIPIIYGDVQSDTGAVKCLRVDRESEVILVEGENVTIYRGTYLVAGHHCKSLDAVFDKDGEPLDMADFDLIEEGTFGQPGERTLFKYKVTGQEFCPDSIRMNVKGKMDSGSNLIEDPIDTVKNIINNYT